MSDPNTGAYPAFPNTPFTYPNGDTHYGFNGLTIRQHFAALAMQGLLADHKDHEDERKWVYVEETNPTTLKWMDALGGGTAYSKISGKWMRKEFTETCAQAVARLAVEHADALVAELEKKP